MTIASSLYQRLKRYSSPRSDLIHTLPIVILMPHSACNCRCVMCDIWKGNGNLKQLREEDISGLLSSLEKLGTEQILMTGGEALLNPAFFSLCRMLKTLKLRITLLSTGLTLDKHAVELVKSVDDIIVSLDGDENVHNRIRNIPNAFEKLSAGIGAIRKIAPRFPITARSVIQQANFRVWPSIIDSAKQMGLNQVSFLPADVSSHAFNREVLWSDQRQHEILPAETDLPALRSILRKMIKDYRLDFESRFIAESPEKLGKIFEYYSACYGHNPFPFKKCNAPWVSTVVEPDGTVRPCFFHPPMGNIRQESLDKIVNREENISFRKNLDTDKDSTCKKCVCYLHLRPGTKLN
ncbi:MAG TPA: radical SAM protein [Chitinophagaceae bacterium]|nr:radical SAM protein [Chitinophagaceae bacterium]